MTIIYPTKQEQDRALLVVKELFSNDFSDAICYSLDKSIVGNYYRLGLSNWLNEHCELLDRLKIAMYSGETKVCIIDEFNPNWVLKISFNRATDPYYVTRKVDWDFCEREVEFYSKACNNNLQDYFAATYQLGKINGVFISIQEAVDADEDIFGNIFASYVREQYDRNDFEDEEDYEEAVSASTEDMDNDDRIYAVLGADSDNLIEFIHEHDINDLHAGNWGITSDGRYVLMDFSGFIS